MLNPRHIIISTTVLASFAAGWWVNGVIWEKRLESRLKEQEALLIGQCNEQKKLTEEVSNDYQKKLSAANRKLADLKRMYSNTAVPVTGKADGLDAAAGGAKLSGKNGIAASSLFELAGECEKERQKVIGLQNYINRVIK